MGLQRLGLGIALPLAIALSGVFVPAVVLAESGEGEKSAAKTGAETEPKVDFRALRDQGIHYLRKKMYEAAEVKLEQARKTTAGGQDFRTHYSLAKLYYEQLLLERAFPAARKAASLAKSPREQSSSKALLNRMEGFFGGVTLLQAEEQKGQVDEGIIHLEDVGGLINVTKKEAFQKIRTRFKTTPVELPLTLYLPFGKYTANLAPLEIKRGKLAEARTFLYKPDMEIPVWMFVGGGVAVAAVTAVVIAVALSGEDEHQISLSPIPFLPESEGAGSGAGP